MVSGILMVGSLSNFGLIPDDFTELGAKNSSLEPEYHCAIPPQVNLTSLLDSMYTRDVMEKSGTLPVKHNFKYNHIRSPNLVSNCKCLSDGLGKVD